MTRRRIALALSLFGTFALAATTVIAADSAPAKPAAAAVGETVTTTSGLQYVDLVVGKGRSPKVGEKVAVNYSIFENGKRIESSSVGQPMVFTIGKDQALKAMEEGVQTMKVGGKRKLTVPPKLAYGVDGVPNRVPPNATMVIEMELVELPK